MSTQIKPVNAFGCPFYASDVRLKLVPETRDLLEKYSNIPSEQHYEHIHRIRNLAWEVHAYPSIGLGTWLVPHLRRLPVYTEIVNRIKNDEVFMEVGCFIGHNFRHLVYEGCPVTNVYGVDIDNYWDLGFEMFCDRSFFHAHFIQADILSQASSLLALKGNVDILAMFQVFHQLGWKHQIEAAKVLTTFTKVSSIIVGSQLGNLRAQEYQLKSVSTPAYVHNFESLERFWNQFGDETQTQTKWKTQAWIRSFESMGWDAAHSAWMEPRMEPPVDIIEFVITRVE